MIKFITVEEFLKQMEEGIHKPTDEIHSIGSVCGMETNIKYIIHCRDENNKEYEIPIRKKS